jgi:hypothetical protein
MVGQNIDLQFYRNLNHPAFQRFLQRNAGNDDASMSDMDAFTNALAADMDPMEQFNSLIGRIAQEELSEDPHPLEVLDAEDFSPPCPPKRSRPSMSCPMPHPGLDLPKMPPALRPPIILSAPVEQPIIILPGPPGVISAPKGTGEMPGVPDDGGMPHRSKMPRGGGIIPGRPMIPRGERHMPGREIEPGTGVVPPQRPAINPQVAMQAAVQQLKGSQGQLQGAFETEKKSQGILGKAWDWTKNTLGTSPEGKAWYDPRKWWGSLVNSDKGSNAVQGTLKDSNKQIEALEFHAKNGETASFATKYKEITGKDFDPMTSMPGSPDSNKNLLADTKAAKGIDKYSKSQKAGADVLADIGSGVVSFAAYAGAVALMAGGVVAAPFTGGLSLAVSAAGLAIAAGTGAVTKAGLKYMDAKTAEIPREYDSLGYDLTTGAVGGLMAPFAAGGGTAVAGSVARRVGVTATTSGLGQLTLAAGTSVPKQLLIRGTQFATEGAIYSGVTTPTRVAASGGSFEDVVSSVPRALVDGAAGGVLVRGGLHGARGGYNAFAGSRFMPGWATVPMGTRYSNLRGWVRTSSGGRAYRGARVRFLRSPMGRRIRNFNNWVAGSPVGTRYNAARTWFNPRRDQFMGGARQVGFLGGPIAAGSFLNERQFPGLDTNRLGFASPAYGDDSTALFFNPYVALPASELEELLSDY